MFRKFTYSIIGLFMMLFSEASCTPNAEVNFADDYIQNQALGTTFSSSSSLFILKSAMDNDHPGVLSTNSNPGLNTCGIFYGSTKGVILGGGQLSINWVFKISALSTSSNRYILRFGLGDTTSNTDQANGVYIEYSDNINAGKWVYKTASGSTRTTLNSLIPVSPGWHNAEILIDPTASSASFSIDGVSLGSDILTNIPFSGISPLYWTVGGSGNGIGINNIYLDLIYLNQLLTVPR